MEKVKPCFWQACESLKLNHANEREGMEESESVAVDISEYSYDDRYFFALSSAAITIKSEIDYLWKMHVRDKKDVHLYEYLALKLLYIAGSKGLIRFDISRSLGVSINTACTIITKAKKKGIVDSRAEKSRNSKFKRKDNLNFFFLTEEGKKFVEEADELAKAAFDAISKLMSKHDMDAIIDIGIDVASKATRQSVGNGKKRAKKSEKVKK